MITTTSFLVASIVMLVLDYIYLSTMKNYFGRVVKSIQGSPLKINVLSTGLTYIFMIFALQYFIFGKESDNKVRDAFLLGLCIYAIFDFTNMAIFNNWDLLTVIIDSLWGASLFAATTYITLQLM